MTAKTQMTPAKEKATITLEKEPVRALEEARKPALTSNVIAEDTYARDLDPMQHRIKVVGALCFIVLVQRTFRKFCPKLL